jgi:uncharacterized Zn finger protein (UPF0148 family)
MIYAIGATFMLLSWVALLGLKKISPRCPVCRSELYDLRDGTFFCDRCYRLRVPTAKKTTDGSGR